MAQPPEQGKNRSQQPSGGGFPEDSAQHQREKASGPQVRPADSEHKFQPGPDHGDQQQAVSQDRMPPAQRGEETMGKSHPGPQRQCSQQPPGSNGRCRHAKNLRQPEARGSS